LFIDAIKGDDKCYEELNILGDNFGHCGTDGNGKYIKCQPE